jgi:nitrate reductase alpha subunit
MGHPFNLHRQFADAHALARRAHHLGQRGRAKKAGIADDDWVEAYNVDGALVARAVVSQRIPEGTTFMDHAQEKMTNVSGSEITSKRGGIHNSVTRATLKPTHMIGGCAQLSYGFNYYGTVGSNPDDFVAHMPPLTKTINSSRRMRSRDGSANVRKGCCTPEHRRSHQKV